MQRRPLVGAAACVLSVVVCAGGGRACVGSAKSGVRLVWQQRAV